MSGNSDERKRRVLHLIEKFRNGGASREEMREIDAWYEAFDREDPKDYTYGMAAGEKAQERDKLLHRINRQIYRETAPQQAREISQVGKARKRHWIYTAVSALVFVSAFAFGILAYLHRQPSHSGPPVVTVDAEPGGNRAVLTLGNGEKVSLTDAPDGQLAREQGIRITKKSDGQLVYEPIPGQEADSDHKQAVVYNSVETPLGGQYQLTLPDGSRVWLNAASSLRYPASFTGLSQRHVELSGEAYFEIAEDRNKAFLVTSGMQTVSVLGTHFNVNAYQDEDLIKTTLLEGRIKLSMDGSASEVTLDPGQEAIQQGPGFIVREADMQSAVAWKNGLFVFNSTDLQTLMRQLGRWYDVEVVYQGETDYKRFFGSIERSYALSEVLEVLKLGNVNFRLEQPEGARKRLVVLPADSDTQNITY